MRNLERIGFSFVLGASAACTTDPGSTGTGFASASGESTSGNETTSTSGESTGETTTDTTDTTDTTESGETTAGDEEGPQLLAKDEAGPRGIAVDATHVYWTNQTTGKVHRVPIAGGDMETLAENQDGAYAIAVDSTHAYWSNRTGDAIMRVAKDGGTPEMIDNAYDPTGIAIDATDIYWISTNGVYKAPKEGGDSEWLTLNDGVLGGIALTSSHVYWTDHGGWDYVPGDTGGIDTDPYLEGRVLRISKNGGSEQVVSGAQEFPFGIDTDSQFTYWVNNTADGDGLTEINKVKRAPLGGGADEDLATMLEAPWSIVALGEWLYYDTKSQIWKLPRTGGVPTLLADMQTLPRYLAVDNAHVFWTNGNGGIMKVAFE